MLVNNRIAGWEQVEVNSPDIVAIRAKTEEWELLIVNVYGDIDHSDTILEVAKITREEIKNRRGKVEVI